jgi:hypothetical protein
MCTLAIWLFVQRSPVAESERLALVEQPAPLSQPAPDPRSLVHVTFPLSADVIAVPQPTDDPSVTVIWVYPTLKAAPQSSPAPTGSFQPSERNGL